MAAILQLKNIHKSYGPQTIFDEASVTMSSEQKIGFIGRNGAGKSTLCKMIIGQESIDSGEIIQSSNLRLSYLEQHQPFTPTESVVEFLTRYTGEEPWRCGKIAARFQLHNDLLTANVTSLPGGYQTRVKLTSMLLRDPNFLILDEPSNYLDLKTLILLEEFLEDFDGGYLIVSHDREFLKKTCDHTLEAELGRLTLYPGTVEEYLTFKDEQEKQAIKRNVTIEGKRKQLQAFVDRFHAKASKASQARSKMKQIQKLKNVELAQVQRNVKIRIPNVAPRQGNAFMCEGLQIGYPEMVVAKDIHMQVEHGAHVAVLGDNGQGKTTFLRTLADDLPPKDGTFKWGYSCEIAYYAQHVVTALNPKHKVLDHLQVASDRSVSTQELLAMASCFLFKDSDLKKPISVLSGGECARLCLAGLLLMKRSVLLLDEPTNHLDFETVEALGAALRQFTGTVFFICHDRTFVNMVASEIIEVRDGAVTRYPGNYAEYVYHLEQEIRYELTHDESAPTVEQKPKKASDYMQRKRAAAARKRLVKQVERSEKQQQAYLEERKELEAIMLKDPAECTSERAARFEQLGLLQQEEEKRWLAITEELEAFSEESSNGN